MFLPNPVVYIQFHPVVYIVKLNIEMSMASLVVKLARGRSGSDACDPHSSVDPRSNSCSNKGHRSTQNALHNPQFNAFQLNSVTKG
jgi:hypothetical protein